MKSFMELSRHFLNYFVISPGLILQTRPLPQILLFFQNNNLMDLKLQTEIYVNIERTAVYGRVSSV